jgi:hypothetical protein
MDNTTITNILVASTSNLLNFISLVAAIALYFLGAVGGRVLGNLSHRWVVGLWTLGSVLLFYSISAFILVSLSNIFWFQISLAVGVIFGFAMYLWVRDKDLTIDDIAYTRKLREPYLSEMLPKLNGMQLLLDKISETMKLDDKVDIKMLDEMTDILFVRIGGWMNLMDSTMPGYRKYCLLLTAAMEAFDINVLSNNNDWLEIDNKFRWIRINVPDNKLQDLLKWHLILFKGMCYDDIYARYIHKLNTFDHNQRLAAIAAQIHRKELGIKSFTEVSRRIEYLRMGGKIT